MKHFLLLFGIFLFFTSFSQSLDPVAKLDQSISRAYSDGFRLDLRRSFGIYPEIQFIRSPVIGISASLARLKDVEWSSFNRGMKLGFEFDPTKDFYGPKVSVWGDAFALFVGGNVGLSMMYYRQVNKGGVYLRPEIGIGIPRLHLKYGYGFRVTGDEIIGFQKHTLTLGYHLSLIERK